MRFVNRTFVVAAAVSLAAAFTAAEDLTIVSKVSRDGGPPETVTSYLSSERVRMAHGDGREAIVDYKKGEMISIDHKKQTYSVTTQKDIEEWTAKVQERMNNPEMKKAREAMKDLPPEQRKAVEGLGTGLFEVEKVGTSRKIAGYACENWTISMGRMSRSEECLTSDLRFPLQPFEVYKHFMESMRTMMASMGGLGADYTKMSEQFKKLKGYPLAVTTTVDIMGRKSVTSSEVVEVKRTPIPTSAWDIPAGYAKVDNPMARGFEGRRKG